MGGRPFLANPQNPPEELGENEDTETPGGNTGSGFVGSSSRSASCCETSLCLPGSVTEDSRRTTSRELVPDGAGAELPALVSATGSVVMFPPLVAITKLGVLVTESSGSLPPLAEVVAPLAGKRYKLDLYTLKCEQMGPVSSISTLRLTKWVQI